MVEVFKTDVTNQVQATNLISIIESYFEGYKANFDLQDCDHILRIEVEHVIDADSVIRLLKGVGVIADVLPEEIPLLRDYR